MRRLLSFVLVVLGLFGLGMTPARADDRSTCFDNNSAPDVAIPACDRFLASRSISDQDRSIAYHFRGSTYFKKRDYDRAIHDYDEAIRLQPTALAYTNRGDAYASKADYDSAIRDYDEAIRLEPNAERYTDRGHAYRIKGDYDRAIRDYDEAIRLDPENAIAYNSRGVAYYNKRDYDRAIADYTEGLRLDPKNAIAYNNRGVAYARKDDYDRAIADYSEAIRLDPKYLMAYMNRGITYGSMGDHDRAIADLNESIRLDPKNVGAYTSRGYVLNNKGEYDRAIPDLSEAIRLAPQVANAYAHRGDAYRNKGELGRASADIEAAIRLDPKYSFAYTYRGLLYEAKGETERARADFNAALALPLQHAVQKPAHDIARQRLAALTAPSPAPTVAPPVPLVAAAPTSPPAPAITAPSERRVALVIGNSAYRNTTPLANPKNDANDVAAALKALGFETILETDLDRRGMDDTFRRFARLARESDAALFYYAGHAMQFAGVNYLMPIDAKLQDEADLQWEMSRVDDVVTDLARAKNIRIVVLDACRDNPLADRLRMSLPADRSAAIGRGLVRPERTHGLITAFATQPGQTAKDGVGSERNSPFTSGFLKHIATPGIEAATVFRRVAQEVSKATGGRQLPELSISLLGEFYFAGLPTVVGPPTPTGPSEAAQAWAATKDTTSPAILEAFIRRFGDSFYADLARARLEELKKSQIAIVAPPVAPTPPIETRPQPAVGVFPSAIKVDPLSPERERSLTPKDNFKECDACPEMVVVPAGSFTMGSPASEAQRGSDEGPQRRVSFVRQFAVGKFAVTFDDWDACVADGGCNGYRPSDEGWGRVRRPVINVNWDDAKAYATWLSKKTGKTYRLLSEAEREYVTRAGTATPFWWGPSILPSQANYDGKFTYGSGLKGEDRQKTLPVDSFQPNPWGLYQVHGNVWEWTEDCWNASYNGAPTDGSAWTGQNCSKVLRGGSWNNHPISLRSAFRFKISRFSSAADSRHNSIGFRVARTIAP